MLTPRQRVPIYSTSARTHHSASTLSPVHRTSCGAGICSKISPPVLLPPRYALAASALSRQTALLTPSSTLRNKPSPTSARLTTSAFANRIRDQSMPSTRPLHGHQSASALRCMHRPSWAAGIRSGTSPPVLYLPFRPQPLWHSEHSRRSNSLHSNRVGLPRLYPPNVSCHFYPTLWILRTVHDSRVSQRLICVLSLHCMVGTESSLQ